MHPDWLIPDWPAPRGVHAVCTTRAGGRSEGPYESMNLGVHVGDRAEDVNYNRTFLSREIGVEPYFLNQVHGNHCHQLTKSSARLPVPVAADASYTRNAGLVCSIMVADCLPILLTNLKGDFVAAAHAGWRGLAGAGAMNGVGVLEQLLKELSVDSLCKYDYHASKVIAWLGPCIGPAAFEVGAEVMSEFVRSDLAAGAHFVPKSQGKYLADLAGLARLRLANLGVDQVFGNDSSARWCTMVNRSNFFSFRRDGICGRFAACIWRD